MTAKKRGLGSKGFDVLLGATRTEPDDSGHLRDLPLEWLQRGSYQPRRDMDPTALQELSDSIRTQGVVQPLVVRPLSDQRFEIIAGERRWRAAQLAGLETVPAIVRGITDQVALALALIENIQRENLNPLEEAMAIARLVEEFGLTHQQAAETVGRSRVSVSNLLRLLDLNDDVRERLARGELEMGHARALLGLKGHQQSAVAAEVVRRELSVRATERLVQQALAGEQRPPRNSRMDPDVRRLQTELSERLGATVTIQQGRQGKGKLVINYGSLDELDGILQHIG
ncbi:ParB/RepB/Spo0J family partition protein [Methylonatrum kenyense]|uniref:ParB/RepB/Spo0J family partition protein n=1 Tax=Methylonatrum kenyense TaxID=455253 RepID=UPI0020C14766|nr:ParB/RepB/Spo0J family partition protein [Methylonatrum kenyense]MCK8515249.1 ParB/RepB/Spo0J family partition protein [Methylonatrum kenyense]